MIAVFSEVQARDIASRIESDWHFAKIESTIAAAHQHNRFNLDTIKEIKELVDGSFQNHCC